jgi:hypothetical protein
MQNHQGYPLMISNKVGEPYLLLRSPEYLLKLAVKVILTPLHYRPSFVQRFQTQQSMQNHQGYPLMTSNLVGKPSILLRSPENPLKPSVKVILTPLFYRSSFAHEISSHQ